MKMASIISQYYVSELVKYDGKDCVVLSIEKNMFGYNEYKLWNLDNGETITTVKSRISKNDVETINFGEFDSIMNSNTCDKVEFDMESMIKDVESVSDEQLLNLVEMKVENPKVKGTEEREVASRHCTLDENDLDNIADANNEKSTKYSTKWSTRLFREWLVERGYSADFENDGPEELAQKLRQFYGEVNTKNSEGYSRSSLIGIRAGLNRHLQNPPFNRTINIVIDKEFMSANKVLTGRVKLNRANGLDVTKHKCPIPPGDLDKMYQSGTLSNSNPVSLQNKVFFELCFHFGRRGREGLHGLKKSSFIFVKDDENNELEYVTLTHNEKSKKNQGTDPKRRECDNRMYSSFGDVNCPVRSLKLYLSKLHPSLDRFFQKPRSCSNVMKEQIWYCNKPLGVNTLSGLMKNISKQAGLTKIYTNHCIRATTSTVLAHSDFNHNDIISITGHKDTKSLQPYLQSTSSDQRKKMSSALHSYGKAPSLSQKASSPNKTSKEIAKSSGNSIGEKEIVSSANILNDVTYNYNIVSQNKGEISASDMAMKVFQGNTINGGNFNINFNFYNK